MNKKIAMSAISIVTALSLMGGATFAAFSSQASNNGNTFGTGSLVLQINGAGGSASTPIYGVANAIPGNTYDEEIDLTNTGSVPASNVVVTGIDIGGANPALASDLVLTLYIDENNDGLVDGGDTSLGSAPLNDAGWTGFTMPGVSIPATGTEHMMARITYSSGATTQGQNVTFNLNFQANQ